MRRFVLSVFTVAGLTVGLSFMLTAEAVVKDNFWNEAAMGGMAEVSMAQLALQKSQSESVRQFAQHMVDDHTAANNELMSLASSKNVTLPTGLDAKHQAMMTKMGSMSGMDFDREYMKGQVKDHEKMVKLFQNEAANGADADVKAFAAKTLPTLQSHLQMARSMSSGMKSGMSGETRSEMNSGSNMSSNRRSNSNMNSNTNSNRRNNSNGANSNRRTNTNMGNTNGNSNR